MKFRRYSGRLNVPQLRIIWKCMIVAAEGARELDHGRHLAEVQRLDDEVEPKITDPTLATQLRDEGQIVEQALERAAASDH